MRGKRIRQGRARAHLLVDVVQDGLEDGVGEADPQDVQRLHQRHAGLEQRGELLVEDQELVTADPRAPPAEREAAPPPPLAERKDVQPFLLELAPQGGFALGDVDTLDDLARRGTEPAAVFHP